MTGRRGTLFLVVGPSGAGKDSLIERARLAFSDRGDVVFARREITRPEDAGGEAHLPIDPADFEQRLDAGAYALSWRAHDLGYGVPVSILDDLAAGRSVVVNVSRGVIDEARRRFAPVRVLSIRVPAEVLAKRLGARGREDEARIADRVARAAAFAVAGEDVVEITNDGSLEHAEHRFISAISDALPRR